MSGNTSARSVAMPADSTQDTPATERKNSKTSGARDRKKDTKKKIPRKKKHSKEKLPGPSGHVSPDEGSEHESDLDLSRNLHPIGYYMRDRQEMMKQMLHSIGSRKLHAMLPAILQPLAMEELERLCMEQLLAMSNKRVRRLLEGADPEAISSTDSEESSSDEEESTAEIPVKDGVLTKIETSTTEHPLPPECKTEPNCDEDISDATCHGLGHEPHQQLQDGDRTADSDTGENSPPAHIPHEPPYSQESEEREEVLSASSCTLPADKVKKMRRKVNPVLIDAEDMEEGEVLDTDSEYETDTEGEDGMERYEEDVSSVDLNLDEEAAIQDECGDSLLEAEGEVTNNEGSQIMSEDISDLDRVEMSGDNFVAAVARTKETTSKCDGEASGPVIIIEPIDSPELSGWDAMSERADEMDTGREATDEKEVEIELDISMHADSPLAADLADTEVEECSSDQLTNAVASSSDNDDNVTVTIACKEFGMGVVKQQEQCLARFPDNIAPVGASVQHTLPVMSARRDVTENKSPQVTLTHPLIATGRGETDIVAPRTVILKSPIQPEPPKTLSGRRIVLKRKMDQPLAVTLKRKSSAKPTAEQAMEESGSLFSPSACIEQTVQLPDSSAVANLKVEATFSNANDVQAYTTHLKPVDNSCQTVVPTKSKSNLSSNKREVVAPTQRRNEKLVPIPTQTSKSTLAVKTKGNDEGTTPGELSSTPTINPPRVELALTQTQMEIMELEMRARAIKAMLKAQEEFEKHSTKPPPEPPKSKAEPSRIKSGASQPAVTIQSQVKTEKGRDDGNERRVITEKGRDDGNERRVITITSHSAQPRDQRKEESSTVRGRPDEVRRRTSSDISSRLLSISHSRDDVSRRRGEEPRVLSDQDKFHNKLRADWVDSDKAYASHSEQSSSQALRSTWDSSARAAYRKNIQSSVRGSSSQRRSPAVRQHDVSHGSKAEEATSGRAERREGSKQTSTADLSRSRERRRAQDTSRDTLNHSDDSDGTSSDDQLDRISQPLEHSHIRPRPPEFSPHRGNFRGRPYRGRTSHSSGFYRGHNLRGRARGRGYTPTFAREDTSRLDRQEPRDRKSGAGYRHESSSVKRKR